jgi:hypothetical protein
MKQAAREATLAAYAAAPSGGPPTCPAPWAGVLLFCLRRNGPCACACPPPLDNPGTSIPGVRRLLVPAGGGCCRPSPRRTLPLPTTPCCCCCRCRRRGAPVHRPGSKRPGHTRRALDRTVRPAAGPLRLRAQASPQSPLPPPAAGAGLCAVGLGPKGSGCWLLRGPAVLHLGQLQSLPR